jgi:hypothetical protein
MTRREFTIDDGMFFAKCSGDYNLIHIDPVASRRFMFGEPIVHGLHTVLWALDIWLGDKENKNVKIVSLNVSFPKAVVLNKTVVCKLAKEFDDQAVLEIIQNDVVCSKIKLKYSLDQDISLEALSTGFANVPPPKECPKDLNFEELKNSSGVLDQYLDEQSFSNVFPNVFKHIDKYHIATLLSSTRVIGMYCPGLNSLISSLEFSFSENDCRDKKLKYEVSKVDERFNMLFISLVTSHFNGKVRTFMRPTPVNQLSYLDVVCHVKPDEFKGQKVLIVGGSRGLGEITTKILVAGGASVRFTYNRGIVDAEKIEKELSSYDKFASKIKLNVLDFQTYDSLIYDDWIPTHCYYFATPFIFSGVKGVFSESLFEQFNSVYTTSFIKLVTFLKQKGTFNYFYPSTVAIDEMPDNMVEYTISKYSAQKACEVLRSSDNSLKIEMYKFPRMETDQTVSFLPVKNHDPLEYTLSFIRSFNLTTS